MNMKKTMAAIAAGAVAVSAMATTVSALEDQTLTYELAGYKEISTASSSATLQASFTGITGKADLAKITFTGLTDVSSITIRIVPDDVAEQTRTYTYSSDDGSLNYNKKLSKTGFEFEDELSFIDTNANITTATVIVTVNSGVSYDKVAGLNAALNSAVKIEDAAGKAVVTPTVATAFNGATKTVYRIPFRTGPNNNQNIPYYLQTGIYTPFSWKDASTGWADINFSVNGTRGSKDNKYQNVLPVLNDAIENYESVVFTFHTAADSIVWTPAFGDNSFKKFYCTTIWDETYDGDYAAGLVAVGGDASRLIPVYDSRSWGADSSYKSFTQHLYNGTGNFYGAGSGWVGYGGEEYLGFDWNGQNLFGGALVINENLTMSLSDVDYFDWTATTLSFDWDAIMDGAATSNNYATYVQSIKLATSVTWYWDSMDVVLVAGDVDRAEAQQGLEGDEETLDDDGDLGDEIIDGGDETPAVEDETPAVDDTADVPAVSSPQTGNAPVALAVIPVALAAAAIVAKKRG